MLGRIKLSGAALKHHAIDDIAELSREAEKWRVFGFRHGACCRVCLVWVRVFVGRCGGSRHDVF